MKNKKSKTYQLSYRKQLIQFAETWMSHQCYFEIGGRHMRGKIFTLLKEL